MTYEKRLLKRIDNMKKSIEKRKFSNKKSDIAVMELLKYRLENTCMSLKKC